MWRSDRPLYSHFTRCGGAIRTIPCGQRDGRASKVAVGVMRIRQSSGEEVKRLMALPEALVLITSATLAITVNSGTRVTFSCTHRGAEMGGMGPTIRTLILALRPAHPASWALAFVYVDNGSFLSNGGDHDDESPAWRPPAICHSCARYIRPGGTADEIAQPSSPTFPRLRFSATSECTHPREGRSAYFKSTKTVLVRERQ